MAWQTTDSPKLCSMYSGWQYICNSNGILFISHLYKFTGSTDWLKIKMPLTSSELQVCSLHFNYYLDTPLHFNFINHIKSPNNRLSRLNYIKRSDFKRSSFAPSNGCHQANLENEKIMTGIMNEYWKEYNSKNTPASTMRCKTLMELTVIIYIVKINLKETIYVIIYSKPSQCIWFFVPWKLYMEFCSICRLSIKSTRLEFLHN